jgi:RND superfamily putative drug exporter
MTTIPKSPVTERVAGWSARHRIIAVVGWLLLVAAAFTLGQHMGQGNVKSYDPGQAGQAERVLNRPVVQSPPQEQVLVAGRAPGQTYANDSDVRQAVSEVVSALKGLPKTATDIRSPLTSPGLVSPVDGAALVTFQVITPG